MRIPLKRIGIAIAFAPLPGLLIPKAYWVCSVVLTLYGVAMILYAKMHQIIPIARLIYGTLLGCLLFSNAVIGAPLGLWFGFYWAEQHYRKRDSMQKVNCEIEDTKSIDITYSWPNLAAATATAIVLLRLVTPANIAW